MAVLAGGPRQRGAINPPLRRQTDPLPASGEEEKRKVRQSREQRRAIVSARTARFPSRACAAQPRRAELLRFNQNYLFFLLVLGAFFLQGAQAMGVIPPLDSSISSGNG